MLKTAIFVNDYLLLLDFLAKIEEEFHLLDYTIFGDKEFATSLDESAEGYIETDLSLIKEAELLIMLAQPLQDESDIKNFDGTVINAVDYNFNASSEVFKVDEPIRKILKNIAVPIKDASIVLSLPVCIYGKSGVEDLMQQTRSVFTFNDTYNLIFNDRIAFNKHFNPIISSLPVGRTVDDFFVSGGSISVRISPLSTVFEMDIFAKGIVSLKNDNGYSFLEGFFTASDVSESSEIVVMLLKNGLTFVGDYMRVFIKDIIEKMKEVMQ